MAWQFLYSAFSTEVPAAGARCGARVGLERGAETAFDAPRGLAGTTIINGIG